MVTRVTRQIEDQIWQVQAPAEQDGRPPVILLLHGWTGDDDAMWVFGTKMPKQAWLLAPRGIYSTPLGGYGWHPHQAGAWPWVDDFQPAMDALLPLLNQDNFPGANFEKLWLAGFSQGAALAYTIALRYPQRVQGVAGLAGFLPKGSEALARNRPLAGKSVYVTHGTQDQLVPVARARQAIEILQQAGAQVTYCEADVGHKLSATCFNGLEKYLQSELGEA